MKVKKETITTFSVVEESVLEEKINGYGYFGKMEINQETKEKMLKNLAYKLGIMDGYRFTNGTGDGFEKTTLTKEGKYAVTTLQMISMQMAEAEPEQYIVIDIQTQSEMDEAALLYQKVNRVYEEIGVDGHVSFEVNASQEGDCTTKEKEGLTDEVFELIEAEKIDSITENDLFTVYGYTKLEDSYLKMNGKKVNVQVVMSYDEQEDKTYMKIGVPIVNTSY